MNYTFLIALTIFALLVGPPLLILASRENMFKGEQYRLLREFKTRLADSAKERGLGGLVNVELGNADKEHFWLVTINHPFKGVEALVIRMGAVESVYSDEALEFVLERLDHWSAT